ncbi:MAG: reverse transcriptase family protein [Clostridiales bacterium]|jgi:RNA-directed DNA polymerase|nr:reverse transcriptase family protein [Clostridiales bacterium]
MDNIAAHLQKETGLSMIRIESILADTKKEYRTYSIPKSTGGRRSVSEPSADLKALQRAVLPYIKKPEVNKAASAYESGSSVKKNAERHIKGKHILHMDIKDFFPSVGRDMFFDTYSGELSVGDAELLWKIVSLDGGLPIGAATSPFIANRIMAKTDKKLGRLSLSVFLKYTRYADDMIFSSRIRLRQSLADKIGAIIENAGFEVNGKKTYFMSARKQVTGIIITDNNELSVGTSYKKQLKKDIYNLLVKNSGKRGAVRGKYAHLQFIEPEYADTVKKKYIRYDKIGFFK